MRAKRYIGVDLSLARHEVPATTVADLSREREEAEGSEHMANPQNDFLCLKSGYVFPLGWYRGFSTRKPSVKVNMSMCTSTSLSVLFNAVMHVSLT